MNRNDLQASVLVVEDDDTLRTSIATMLCEQNILEISVHEAATGAEALHFIHTHSYDLVLLDVVLPDSDGFILAEKLRAQNTAFIMLSSRTLPLDVIAGFEAGAEDYLRKPIDLRELTIRVYYALTRIKKSGKVDFINKNHFKIGSFELDISTRTAHMGDRTYELTPIETDILSLLAENSGRYVSTDRLIHSIWREQAPADGHLTVRVHIRRLRAKIEPDPQRPVYILNKWGAGYMLAPPD